MCVCVNTQSYIMPGECANCCDEPSCAFSLSSSTKFNQKDLRVVACIQPQCSRKFHAACIGWAEKSKTEFVAESKLFLCTSCLNYVNAISVHISQQVKDDLLENIRVLDTRLTAYETKLNNCISMVNKLEGNLSEQRIKIDSCIEVNKTQINTNFHIIDAKYKSQQDSIDALKVEMSTKIGSIEQQLASLSHDLKSLTSIDTSINPDKNFNSHAPNENIRDELIKMKSKLDNIQAKPLDGDSERLRFQIRVAGIPENKEQNVLKRQENDLNALQKILNFLELSNINICDILRLGKYDSSRTKPRNILVTFQSPWDARKVMQSAFKLKGYEFPIFISPALDLNGQKKEKRILKKRYELIRAGVKKEQLKIKSNKLYQDGNEVNVD